MKVVLINTHDNNGGAAIACKRLQKALSQKGIEATMLVHEKTGIEQGVTPVATTALGKRMAFARFALERLHFWFHEKSKAVRFAFSPASTGISLARHPLVQQADVIHLHWINFGYLTIEDIGELVRLNKPIVWTLHDMWMFTGGCHHSWGCTHYYQECGNCPFLKRPSPNDLSHTVHLRKQKAIANTSIATVTCSRWLAGCARNSSLLQGMPVTTIPNPIDTEVFKPLPQAEARKALGMPADKVLILFAAMRIEAPLKGLVYFQKALELLAHQHPHLRDNIELMVIGMGDPAITASMPFVCHALGHINSPEKMALVYSCASLFVLPSLEENLPNTVMESLACGTPVAAFRTGGVPDLIEHQQTGYLATRASAEELAEGIYWLISHPEPQALRTNARQKVLTNYTEDIVAEQYIDLYKEIGGEWLK